MQIRTVGLDLAKNVFQVHGVNRHGKVNSASSSSATRSPRSSPICPPA